MFLSTCMHCIHDRIYILSFGHTSKFLSIGHKDEASVGQNFYATWITFDFTCSLGKYSINLFCNDSTQLYWSQFHVFVPSSTSKYYSINEDF